MAENSSNKNDLTTTEDSNAETALATDEEGQPKKLKYPRSIAFIISNEFCERFNYYGMRTILVLYLTIKLGYDSDTATVIYHTFTSAVYFLTVLGAIIADSWLGKFRTILYLSIVYACGSVVIALGAMPPLNFPAAEITMLGLFLIALGSGGIKPCVAAFGGDQFKLPEQASQIVTFFSLFYFSINAGSMISTFVTPILRQDVHCFGDDDCYSLAFGVPGALMLTSILVFIAGKFMYIMKAPTGNMVVLVSKCIGNAISTRRKEKKINPKEHWMDYAEQKYGKQLVKDTKSLLNLLVLYIPLPVFWALFDQQGSRWTFQATRMNGDVGALNIKPDQVQVINPFLILVFIPLYDFVFYPLLSKIGVRRPLQKLTIGGVLAGVSFIISAIVELELEKTYAVIPGAGEAQLRIFNGMPCDYTVTTNVPDHASFVLKSMDEFTEKYLSVPNQATYSYSMTSLNATCSTLPFSGNFQMKSATATSYFASTASRQMIEFQDNPEKANNGYPLFITLANFNQVRQIQFQDKDDNQRVRYDGNSSVIEQAELYPSTYQIYVGDIMVGEFEMRLGGVYTFILREISANNFDVVRHEITEPNSVSMLWLIPQYVVLTLGEVMYSVTGLEFSYSQSPLSMKSVIQSAWLLTVGIGNLIVVIVAGARGFDSQAHEFFLFAGLMFVDMFLFALLAMRYKCVEIAKEEDLIPIDDGKAEFDERNGQAEMDSKKGGLDNPNFKNDQ